MILFMEPDSIIITAFITVMSGGLGTLFWARLNRIEAHMATRHDLDQLRHDIDQLRDEMGQLRSEQAIMRSDLTHIALAVGARGPRASEG
jgi:hypothetical protein